MLNIIAIFSGGVTIFSAWLFFMTALMKLNIKNRNYYLKVISAYGMTKKTIANTFITVAGILELSIAFILMVPNMRGFGLLAAATLVIIYLLAMAVQLFQGKREVDCGCSGPGKQLNISVHLLVRNSTIATVIIISYMAVVDTGWVFWSMSIIFAVNLILVYVTVDQLISNDQKLGELRRLRGYAKS